MNDQVLRINLAFSFERFGFKLIKTNCGKWSEIATIRLPDVV